MKARHVLLALVVLGIIMGAFLLGVVPTRYPKLQSPVSLHWPFRGWAYIWAPSGVSGAEAAEEPEPAERIVETVVVTQTVEVEKEVVVTKEVEVVVTKEVEKIVEVTPTPTRSYGYWVPESVTPVATLIPQLTLEEEVARRCGTSRLAVLVDGKTYPCPGHEAPATEVPAPAARQAQTGSRSAAPASMTQASTDFASWPKIDAPVGQAACPTDAELQQMHGWSGEVKPVFLGEGSRSNTCHWQVQAVSFATFDLPLIRGFAYDVTLPDERVAIFYGDGEHALQVEGADITYVLALPMDYFPREACRYAAQEIAFGLRREPTYLTILGNVNCPPLFSFNPSVYQGTQEWLAAAVGGDPEFWTLRDWEGGADVYKRKEHWTTLRLPIELNASLDFWYEGGPVTVSVGQNAHLFDTRGTLVVNPDEASFHLPR
jgi:hypothetical protein